MAEPLRFTPPRMYVLDDVWDDPRSARRAERLAAAWPGIDVRTFSYSDLPEIVDEEGWGKRRRMGELDDVPPPIPILGMFRFDPNRVAAEAKAMRDAYTGEGGFPWDLAAGGGAFVFFWSQTGDFNCEGLSQLRPNPQHVCRPQWRIHQGEGCPHQCAYCSLGDFLITHVNTEEYIEKLAELLDQNPWQKTWLYDDVMDIPTLEPQLDTLAPLMRFFESTGDRYLIIHTKTDRAEAILKANAPKNTIIAWSLSGRTQSTVLEPETGTTEGRIEAARRCQEAGMTIRYKFKPIIPVKSWREDADEMVDLALSTTRPDNLSMTALMWMRIEELRRCLPPDMMDEAFMQAAEDAKDEMGPQRVGPFPDEIREQIYRHYMSAVRSRDAEIPLTLSTESMSMWQRLGNDLGVTPANYVCGCGAGATPGRLLLETSPWHNAREAKTWRGEPAL